MRTIWLIILLAGCAPSNSSWSKGAEYLERLERIEAKVDTAINRLDVCIVIRGKE